MDTIVLTLEEAEQSLARLVQRMREDHLAVVVKDGEGPVAYLTLAWRLKDFNGGESAGDAPDPSAEFQQPHVGQRYGVDKQTGCPVVNGRQGQRMITAEEIYEVLRTEFP